MNPNTQPIQAQARQIVQGAMPPQGGMPQVAPRPAPQMAKPSGLPVPPPQVALQLAKQALTMPPMVLGTLIWRALHQHGQAIGQLGKNSMQMGAMQPPQGMTGGPNVQAR